MIGHGTVRSIGWALGHGLMLGMAAMSCGPRIDAEHCLFQGGDRGCAEDQRCMVVIGGGVVPGASKGCLDAAAAQGLDPDAYLHLRYGLPAALRTGDGVRELDSVEGIFAWELVERGLPARCSVDAGVSSVEQRPELEVVLAARARLERLRGERRFRDDEASVSAEEATAVERLDADIEAWILACEEEPGDGSGTESDGSTSSSGTGSSSAGEMGCVSHEQCEHPETPFCGPDGACVRCDALPDPDAACAELDPTTPVCADGTCVQCTAGGPEACEQQLLVCDADSHTCVSCRDHGQCSAGACDSFWGTCFPPGSGVEVGPGSTFASIADAVASFPPGAAGVIIIHESAGAPYQGPVDINQDRRIALLAAPGERPEWESAAASTLTVTPGGAVFIEGLTFRQNSTALTVEGGSAWLDRVELVENGIGILVEDDADLVLRNCIVTGVDAIELFDTSTVTISYSTLIGIGEGFPSNSLFCAGIASATVRNSILVVDGGMVSSNNCPDAMVSYSATTFDFEGEGNEDVTFMNGNWFVDTNNQDFHLSELGAETFAGIARWQTGDPYVDLDGDPRPGIDGASDFAGADVP